MSDGASTIVSVDDHLVEPPDLWLSRLPAKLRERAPRTERCKAAVLPASASAGLTRDQLDDAMLTVGEGDEFVWCDAWTFEDHGSPLLRSIASAGLDPNDIGTIATTYDEIRPGCYDRESRLADMDLDGVAASLCFPNDFIRFCGQRFAFAKDKKLGLACITAYNDFLIEEWAGPSGGRLLGAAILPLWDAEMSADEVRRNAERGSRAVCFSEIPAWLGLPSMYSGAWDPLFAACQETGVVLCMHVGSSSNFVTTSSDAPRSVPVINFSNNTALSFTDWLMSGTLDRFPDLRIAFAEGQVGWVPYVLNRIEVMWREQVAYNEVSKYIKEPPRHYLKNMYFCVFDDAVGLSHLDMIGENNVCMETDYPHPDGTYPNSLATAEANLKGLDEPVKARVMKENAIELFGFSVG